MAQSMAHRWGQIIGDLFEAAIGDVLRDVARRHDLYLDSAGDRPARTGRKVRWLDRYNNYHELDYVLERRGSARVIGEPVAFIETAWRGYTKHARNKAQEIQGAILPLAETYSKAHPFLGVCLAGAFTNGSLDQLRSLGFKVLYLPPARVKEAFACVGIDPLYDESEPEESFEAKIRAFERLSPSQIEKLKRSLLTVDRTQVAEFLRWLEESLSRRLHSVTVTVLHGKPEQLPDAARAIAYIENYRDDRACDSPVSKYEIDVRYSNGDTIHAIFQGKSEAVNFLKAFT